VALSKEALATILANRFDVDNEGFVVSSQELTRLTKRRFPNSKKTKKYLRKLKNILCNLGLSLEWETGEKGLEEIRVMDKIDNVLLKSKPLLKKEKSKMAKEMTCGDCKYFGKKSCPFVTEDLEPDEETCEEFKKNKKGKKGKKDQEEKKGKKGKKDQEEKKGKKGKKDQEEKKGKKGKKDQEEKKGKKGKKGKKKSSSNYEEGEKYKVTTDDGTWCGAILRISSNGNLRFRLLGDDRKEFGPTCTVNPDDVKLKPIDDSDIKKGKKGKKDRDEEVPAKKKGKKGKKDRGEEVPAKKKKGGKKDGEDIANVLEALFKGKFGGKNRGPFNIDRNQFAEISGYKKVKDDLLNETQTELLNLGLALIDVPEEDILVVIEAKKFASLRSPSKKEWTKLSKTF